MIFNPLLTAECPDFTTAHKGVLEAFLQSEQFDYASGKLVHLTQSLAHVHYVNQYR